MKEKKNIAPGNQSDTTQEEREVSKMNEPWTKVMRKCLHHAETLLDKETAPTVETVEAVRGLVETAIFVLENTSRESPVGPGVVIHLEET